ncbi:MAG: N-6 DNA methylase [Rhodoferax sp.]|nr:N-6 DNA methylase [Rhodoferax sp.]MBP7492565.1 N-6 DNA methylase [Rhodoferax sp.]
MSQHLINDYLNQLDIIKKVSGSQRETIVREAFKDLLKSWGKQQGLVFLAEYPLKTAFKSNINVDGALLHELRLPMGYWEAKDADDDLNREVSKKFKKGYPQDNIIFSDDAVAVLWQNRAEVLRCDMTDTEALAKLLKLFFGFERPEIAGFRAAVAQFKTDLPAVLQALRDMITQQEKANASFRAAAAQFLRHAQEAINPVLTDADVREMLIQHILTEEIFAKVFDDSDFHQHNNVASELYALEGAFFTGSLKKDTLKGLEPYYAAIRATAAQISSHSEKQTFLKVIYENFYKVYNAKAADRLGVVYSPGEIVRFMIDGADWLCEKHFGKNLIDKDVDILDPATGTGTFICELLEHFRGQPKKLEHKYKHELHANEVAILPYYVANLNIESTFAAITGRYEEFPNLCFVDTLDNVGLHTAAKGTTAELFGSVSEENVARIKRQNSRRISVVIGNPPYNANQANENDNNKNREYPQIDQRIKQTYIAESTAQKTKLYDMYARFFRWASDRLDENGVLAFVTNRSFIESRTFDGFRKTVAQEFADIYVVDLGGDVRANPKLSGTKHNVFGIQTGVAISFMVKRAVAGTKTSKTKSPARVYYVRRPELETAEEKLGFLAHHPMRGLDFDEVQPDKTGNWVNLTNNDFETLLPLASKETKAAKTAAKERAIFKLHSLGVVTNRDEWVYGERDESLHAKVRYLVDVYNTDLSRQPNSATVDYGTAIKWTRAVKADLQKGLRYSFDSNAAIDACYRPFVKRRLYFHAKLNEMQYQLPSVFGRGDLKNPCLVITDATAQKPWMTCAVEQVPDLHFVGAAAGTVCIPLSRLDPDGKFVDNITDWALQQFTTHYNATAELNFKPAWPAPTFKRREKPVPVKPTISKEQIFHYCYAVLHDPLYREKYAQNLKREFPRIPFYADFWQWADWGAALMQLHIGYEAVTPFALTCTDVPDVKARAAGLAPKALLRADVAAGSITLDSETTLRGIPPEAWTYKLGNRSAIEWVLDQYKEKKPKDPTIREKFDTYRFADYKEKVIDLLMRVTTVSVETVAVVSAMRKAQR